MSANVESRRKNQSVAEPLPRKNRRKRILRMVLVYLVLPYLIICTLFAVLQRRLMYPGRSISAAELQYALEDQTHIQPLTFTSFDELQLNGLFYGKQSSPEHAEQLKVLLYFPGNGGCRLDRLVRCNSFAELGCNVALFDYRGYGDNPGAPSEKWIISDAHKAWEVLTKQMQIPPNNIFIYGESLGGAVATRLAADLSRRGTPPAGLLLSSTFSSMTDVACWHYPWLPVRLLLLDRYDSQSHMPHIACPIVMVHGTEDEIVPLSFGERLYSKVPEAIRTTKSRFIQVAGAQHNDVPIDVICNALQDLVKSTDSHLRDQSPATASSLIPQPLVE